MKEKIIIVVLTIVVIVCCTGCAAYTYDTYELETTKDEQLCAVEGCMEPHMYTKKYCINHNCLYKENTIYICNSMREDGQKYCDYHMFRSIKYSEAEIEKAKKMAQEYSDALVSAHDDIIDICEIERGYKNDVGYLYCECTLVMNDSTKSAMVVICKPDYENMKVLGLKYKEGDDWKWYMETTLN